MIRHFTATAFIVFREQIALHWHPKVKAWLPPGGHIDENEDPVQAVLREVEEEVGLKVEIIDNGPRLKFDYPKQISVPITIMLEDIQDPIIGPHQHIDLIYVCRVTTILTALKKGWRWVSRQEIENGTPLLKPDGTKIAPPKDVLLIAKMAFERHSQELHSTQFNK